MEYLNILLIGMAYIFASVMYAALRSGESWEGMFKYFVEFLFYSMVVIVIIGAMFSMRW